jgi:hypothetical protein
MNSALAAGFYPRVLTFGKNLMIACTAVVVANVFSKIIRLVADAYQVLSLSLSERWRAGIRSTLALEKCYQNSADTREMLVLEEC